ncbi:unnamed protein product [Lymnaea stagnalis]|uniref:Beta-lactamase-related domain-containing protein n=1 Tax=Lymnaea stagnalis TaxID=6523 RepID=A0AAV2I0T3_LYMST
MPPKIRPIPLPTGYLAQGFEQVLDIYTEQFSKGVERGSSFAAYYKGQPVVNLWGGLADEQLHRPWKEETVGFFFSTTKLIASVTVAHLVERDLLRYEDKIAKYWPEFSQNGKDNITLEMLMSYKAGLAAFSENFELKWMRENPKKLSDLLAKQAPLTEPGESVAYSPHIVGLYLSEIVKRVDQKGRSLAEYFKEEIGRPFGIDFYIGLPKHLQYRAARLEPKTVAKEDLMKMMETFKGDISLYRLAFSQPKDFLSTRSMNGPDFMCLPNPSSHGVGSALGVAKLAGILANGGKHEGKTLLLPESIARLQEPMSHGIDLTTGGSNINGRGTWLIPVVEGQKMWCMFGHAGFGDQCGAADPHYKVGWAYTTNYIDQTVAYTNVNKWRALLDVLFQCIHKLEGIDVERRLLFSYTEVEKERRSLTQTSKL